MPGTLTWIGIGVPSVLALLLGALSWSYGTVNENLRNEVELQKQAVLLVHDQMKRQEQNYQRAKQAFDRHLAAKNKELASVAEQREVAKRTADDLMAVRVRVLDVPDEQDPVIGDPLQFAIDGLRDHWQKAHSTSDRDNGS